MDQRSEINNTKAFKLSTNPLFANIRFSEGKINVTSYLISLEINELNKLVRIKPVLLKMKNSSNCICTVSWSRVNRIGWRSKDSTEGIAHMG